MDATSSISSINWTPSYVGGASIANNSAPIATFNTTDTSSISLPSTAQENVHIEQSSQDNDELQSLQAKKSKLEGELQTIRGEVDDAKSKINERKEAINKQNEEKPDASIEQQYQTAKTEFNQAKTAKATAQGELTKAKQDNTVNEQAINTNAQAKSKNASDLSAAQSELASLQPPAQSSGDDPQATANYQAQLAEYNSKKAELQSRINTLNQEKQQLETESRNLQNTKSQLQRTIQTQQGELNKQAGLLKQAQAKLDNAQKAKEQNSPKLRETIAKDTELQTLTQNVETKKNAQAAKESELAAVNKDIATAEAKNVHSQAAKAENANQKFTEAAQNAGVNTADSAAKKQEEFAKAQFGKNYNELTENEKNAIKVNVDGAVTKETMVWAKKQLESDPSNEAAKAVLELGQDNLEAQESLALTRVSKDIEKLPPTLREQAAAAMRASYQEAANNGEDVSAAAMNGLAIFAESCADKNMMRSDEVYTDLKALSASSSTYAQATANTTAGCQDLKEVGLETDAPDPTASKPAVEMLYDQVATGAPSETVTNMLTKLGEMVGADPAEPADAARINRFTEANGLDVTQFPWNASFTTGVLTDNGIMNGEGLLNPNYAPAIKDWAQQNNMWRENDGSTEPLAGSAAIFDWSGGNQPDHTGIVESAHDGKFTTIEGNHYGKVGRHSYDINDPSVMGFVEGDNLQNPSIPGLDGSEIIGKAKSGSKFFATKFFGKMDQLDDADLKKFHINRQNLPEYQTGANSALGVSRMAMGGLEMVDGIANGDGEAFLSGVGNTADGINDATSIVQDLGKLDNIPISTNTLSRVASGTGAMSSVIGLGLGGKELAEGIQEGDARGVISGLGSLAEGTKTGVDTAKTIVNAKAAVTAADTTSKLARAGSTLGTASKALGVAGAGISVVTGGIDIVEGAKNEDGLQVASGALGVASGVAAGAIALGCICPPVLIIGAVTMVAKIGVDIYRDAHD